MPGLILNQSKTNINVVNDKKIAILTNVMGFATLLMAHHLELLSMPIPSYIQKLLEFYAKHADTCYLTEKIKNAIDSLLINQPDQIPDMDHDFLFNRLVNRFDDREFLEFCAFSGRMAVKDFAARTVDAMHSFCERSRSIFNNHLNKGLLSNFPLESLEKKACDILEENC